MQNDTVCRAHLAINDRSNITYILVAYYSSWETASTYTICKINTLIYFINKATVVPPYLWGASSQHPRERLKPWIVPNPICTYL